MLRILQISSNLLAKNIRLFNQYSTSLLIYDNLYTHIVFTKKYCCHIFTAICIKVFLLVYINVLGLFMTRYRI